MRKAIVLLIAIGVSAATAMAADAKAGEAVYDKSCKSCHGPDGTPNPAIGKMLKVEMKDLKSADVQGLSDADIKSVVTDGKGKMKPIKTLSGGDPDNIVAFVRSLKK